MPTPSSATTSDALVVIDRQRNCESVGVGVPRDVGRCFVEDAQDLDAFVAIESRDVAFDVDTPAQQRVAGLATHDRAQRREELLDACLQLEPTDDVAEPYGREVELVECLVDPGADARIRDVADEVHKLEPHADEVLGDLVMKVACDALAVLDDCETSEIGTQMCRA